MPAPGKSPEDRTAALGIIIPPPRPPIGLFLPARGEQRLLFVSGQGPVTPEGVRRCGCVGTTVSIAEARDHAFLTTLNLLSVIRLSLGSLNRVERIVKLYGMVNAAPGFTEHHEVIGGATELLRDVFGETDGLPSGSVAGLGSLPNNITVEIELTIAIKEEP